MNRLGRHFRSTFDQIRDPLLIVDVDGNIRRANPAARSALDFPERGCIRDAVWLDRRLIFDGESILPLLKQSTPMSVGRRLKDPEGNESDIVVDILDLSGGKRGGSRLRLIHIKDHSPYRDYERWKDGLVSMVAHEIKNPLSAMRNSMAVLRSQAAEVMTEGQQNILGVSLRSIDRLTRLLDTFLDVSRIRTGNYTPEPRWVDAGDFTAEVVGTFRTLFNVRRQRMGFTVSNGIGRVFVDAPKLEQILINLLNNAIKFTQEGGEVTVEVEQAGLEALSDELRILPWDQLSELKLVRFTVKDTGIGMTADTLSHLFTRYYKAKGSHDSHGSHLGLSISKTLVEVQNGSLAIESELGVGTCITVVLPADETTFTILARVKSIDRVLSRVSSLGRGVVFYAFRKEVPSSWAGVIDEWGANPVVDPTIEDEKRGGFFAWMLGERLAVSLFAGTGDPPALPESFGPVKDIAGRAVSPREGCAASVGRLLPDECRVARLLNLVVRQTAFHGAAVDRFETSRNEFQ